MIKYKSGLVSELAKLAKCFGERSKVDIPILFVEQMVILGGVLMNHQVLLQNVIAHL